MAQTSGDSKDTNRDVVEDAQQANQRSNDKNGDAGNGSPPAAGSSGDGGNGNGDNYDKHTGPRGNEESGWTREHLYWAIIVVLILLIATLFSVLVTSPRSSGTEPPAEPTSVVGNVTPGITPVPTVAATRVAVTPPPAYPPEQFFILNELIVSGPEGAIGELTGDLVDQGIISQTAQIRVGQLLSGLDPQQCPGLSNIFAHEQDFVIERYNILNEDTDVFDLIRRIQSDDVTAEPNRVIGQPWEIEGSPWEIEGSPWEIEGSSGGSSDVTVKAEASASPEQWAFGKHGMELPTPPAYDWPTGQGILVGVFDTLPFSTDTGWPAEFDIEWAKADWAPGSPMLTLTASSLEDDPDGLGSGGDLGSGMINHGLFVAGLVHNVAPDSTIQLIRVLDKDNVGDMFTLTQSLYNFLLPSNRGGYDGVVINMSLGIRMPPLEARNLAGLPREIQSLQDLITVARCSNVVVVAAAGNNSARVSTPELPNLPAAWSSVIGVSASNINKGLSCFSNQGDIGAPGGDGRETDGPAEICRPRNRECRDAECPFAVIGPISRPSPTSTGFAYWTGSSFAAPMVSGLAAQVLDQANGDLTPAEVLAIIECGATPSNDRYLGAGVIDAQRTIKECVENPPQTAAQ